MVDQEFEILEIKRLSLNDRLESLAMRSFLRIGAVDALIKEKDALERDFNTFKKEAEDYVKRHGGHLE